MSVAEIRILRCIYENTRYRGKDTLGFRRSLGVSSIMMKIRENKAEKFWACYDDSNSVRIIMEMNALGKKGKANRRRGGYMW